MILRWILVGCAASAPLNVTRSLRGHKPNHEWKPGESEASGKRFAWKPDPYDPANEPMEVVRKAMQGLDMMSDSVCPSIPEFVTGTSPAHFPAPRPGRRRLAWFMSMSKPNDAISRKLALSRASDLRVISV